jgi:hypothetical protein
MRDQSAARFAGPAGIEGCREDLVLLALAIIASAALWFAQGLWVWRLFGG